MEILEIGTSVRKETELGKKPSGFTYKIRDIAFKTPDWESTSAKSGKLFYELEEECGLSAGWVSYDSVCKISNIPSEASKNLKELGFNMVSWKEGLPDRPDNSKLFEIVPLLMAIQYHKEGGYGSSWKGKGEYRGIMSNIDRKYDRLDKITMDEIKGDTKTLSWIEDALSKGMEAEKIGESKIDSIGDLANYCLLYLTYVKEKYPRTFKVWVDNNVPEYLAKNIPFLQE